MLHRDSASCPSSASAAPAVISLHTHMNIRHFVAILRIGGSSSIRRSRFRIAVTQRQQQLSTGRSVAEGNGDMLACSRPRSSTTMLYPLAVLNRIQDCFNGRCNPPLFRRRVRFYICQFPTAPLFPFELSAVLLPLTFASKCRKRLCPRATRLQFTKPE